MSKVIGGLFGGQKSNNSASIEAERTMQQNRVAQDRQLAAQQVSEERTRVSRRQPRGRRLFEDGAATMPTTLG